MSDSVGVGFFRFLLRLVGVNIRWSITICVALRRATRPPWFEVVENHPPESVRSGYTICASKVARA